MSVEHHDSGVSTGVVLGIILALLVALVVLWFVLGPALGGGTAGTNTNDGPTINVNPGTGSGGQTAPAPGGVTPPGGESGSGGNR